ncbi:MAG: hypothetical protein ABJQ14_12970, partial [Hyphomicrobiales bacterium]
MRSNLIDETVVSPSPQNGTYSGQPLCPGAYTYAARTLSQWAKEIPGENYPWETSVGKMALY